MTLKEYFAVHIMTGIVSNPDMRMDSRMAAIFAKKYAEHLIEELNNESDTTETK